MCLWIWTELSFFAELFSLVILACLVIPICLIILVNFCHTGLFSCHTERSEVSINLKCALNSVDFSPFYKRLKMTKFACSSLRHKKRFCSSLQEFGKAKFVASHKKQTNACCVACHCEATKSPWQSTQKQKIQPFSMSF